MKIRLRIGLLAFACALLASHALGQTTVPRAFSATSVWNRPIVNPILAPNSSAMIQTSFSPGAYSGKVYVSLSDYSVPVYYATTGTATYTVPVKYPWSPYTVPGEGFGTNVPIPSNAKPASGSDGHMVIVDLQRGLSWDFYQAVKTATGWQATYGIRWNLLGEGYNPVWTAGARAAGTPLIAGLIRYDEMKAGRINHALGMSLAFLRDKTVLVSPPASASQAGTANVNAIPMGSRIQLDPALNLNTLGLTASAKIVARAMQEYGAYIVDCSKTNVIYAEDLQYDTTRSWAGILTATSLSNIPYAKFRVMDPKASGVFRTSDTGMRLPDEETTRATAAVTTGTMAGASALATSGDVLPVPSPEP